MNLHDLCVFQVRKRIYEIRGSGFLFNVDGLGCESEPVPECS